MVTITIQKMKDFLTADDDYMRLDLDIVYRVIKDHMKHFEALATLYSELL